MSDVPHARPPDRTLILALLFRAGSSIIIWVLCLAALLVGTVRAVNFAGVSRASRAPSGRGKTDCAAPGNPGLR